MATWEKVIYYDLLSIHRYTYPTKGLRSKAESPLRKRVTASVSYPPEPPHCIRENRPKALSRSTARFIVIADGRLLRMCQKLRCRSGRLMAHDRGCGTRYDVFGLLELHISLSAASSRLYCSSGRTDKLPRPDTRSRFGYNAAGCALISY